MPEKRKDNKNRILKVGESQRKNGTYEYKYKDAAGKRKSIYAKTLKELRKKEEEVTKDTVLGLVTVDRKTLFKDYAEENIVTHARKPESIRAERRRKNKVVNSCLSNIPLGEIKVSDCQRFITELDQQYAVRTTRGCVSMAKKVLDLAEQDELIRKNPFSKFNARDFITKKKGKRSAVEDKDFDAIIKLCEGNKSWAIYIPMMIVLRESGMRLSEYLGLRVQDVDFENKLIDINHQLYLDHIKDGRKYFSSLKTEKSKRVIPMTDRCYEALLSIYELNKDYIIKDGDLKGLMILSQTHQAINRGTISAIFRKIKLAYIEQTGNENFQFSPHCLRHSCVSRMLRNGVNIKSVQEMMGHDDVETTLNIYAEISRNDFHADVLEKMNSI